MNIIRFISGLFHFDRTNWKAVGFCVLAAAVFWLFNAFNKSHSTNIDFPLVFEYNHERFAPTQPLAHKVKINVSGNGWDLFTKTLGFKLPLLLVPLDRPTEIKKMAAASLVPILASQVGRLHINYVLTDTLNVQLDLRDRHSFKLAADLSGLTFEPGFGRVSPVVILPDSVIIEGPQNYLHQLSDSIVLRAQEEKLSSGYKADFEIDIPKKEIMDITPSSVKVIFEVGRVELITRKIPFTGKRTADSVVATFQIPIDKATDFETAVKEIVATRQKSAVRFLHLPSYTLVVPTDTLTKK